MVFIGIVAPVTVFTYEINRKEFGRYKPNKDYKNLILNGAKY